MSTKKIVAALAALCLAGGAFVGFAAPAMADDETITTEAVTEEVAAPEAEAPAEEPVAEETPAESAPPAEEAPAAEEPAAAVEAPAAAPEAELQSEPIAAVEESASVARVDLTAELLADPVKKVEFCHATASETNPFTFIDTSVNAFFNAGHDTHQNFEDIVPPFSCEKQGEIIDFPGLNWDAEGQAIFNAGCATPDDEPLLATASVSFTAATCTSAELLVLDTPVNATWGDVTDPEGDNDYFVVATANDDAEFAGGIGELEFTGQLDPIDTSEACDDTLVKKVQFCHATGSENNPFVLLDTSVNAFFMAGHDTHQNFGDIVPPFSYVKFGEVVNFPGLNWDADGQAFFENGCKDLLVASASVSTTNPTCLLGELLVLGTAVNSTWGPITDPGGDDDYSVTATADAGAAFAGGVTSLTFEGELAGPIPADDPRCQLPDFALVMPAVTFTQFTCDAAGSFTLGVAEGYNPALVTFTVNGVPNFVAGTYPATGGSTTITAQAVAPDTLEPEWVNPEPFEFVVPTSADCTTSAVLAFTGSSGMMGALTIGGGLLFVGLAALYMRRRQTTTG